jgi:hypothetical protein
LFFRFLNKAQTWNLAIGGSIPIKGNFKHSPTTFY